MKLTVSFFILLKFFSYSNSDLNTKIKIIQAISQVHHFGYYIIICSEGKSDQLLHEKLSKKLHFQIGFSTLILIPVDEVDAYKKRVKAATESRRSNIEMKCLVVYDGQDETSRRKFSALSKKSNTGGKDVWLLFLDGTVPFEEYLNSVEVQFNSQLILAIIKNSTLTNFKAPYKVAKKFPVRITDVGYWTEAGGLNLPIVDVALLRKDFEGLQLRAGTWNYPPFTIVTLNKNGEIIVNGYLVDIWKELSERLNFTYKYYLSKDNASGSVSPDGTWNGLIGMLLRDEIDVAAIQLSFTADRIGFVDFSVPIISTGNKIFYNDIGNELHWGNFFRPFRMEVWLVILVSFVVITICLFLFHSIGCSYNIENYVLKQEYTILGCLIIVFRAFTNQGSDMIPESSPSRIVFYSAYLTMAVILPSYSAALISYLTIQTPYKPFDSFETLLEEGKHMLAVSIDTADYDYFSRSSSPLLKTIFRQLIRPLELSGQLPSDPKEGIKLVCENKNLAFFGNYLSGVLFAENLFLEKGCRIVSIENALVNVDECLGFQKGSPYAMAINLELQKMVFGGLLHRWEKQVYLMKKENHGSAFERITFRHVVQIHCLLIAGYLLAVAFFMLEICNNRKKKYSVAEKDLTDVTEEKKDVKSHAAK